MPVILARESEAVWLDPEAHDQDQLMRLIKPYPADQMEGHPANPGHEQSNP